MPIGIINAVYARPVEIHGSTDTSNFNELLHVKHYLDGIENSHRAALDIAPISELAAIDISPAEKRKELQARLRDDDKWKIGYGDSVDYSKVRIKPGMEVKDQLLTAIPDWNDIVARFTDMRIYDDKIEVDFALAHTNALRLNRTFNTQPDSYNDVSVYGAVHSPNGLLAGYRGGQVYTGTIMTVPAGSLYIDTKGNGEADPIYGIKRELGDEAGLLEENDADFSIKGVIGTFLDPVSCNLTGIVYLIETGKTAIELNDIREEHATREHSSFFCISERGMTSYISSNAMKYRKMPKDPKAENPDRLLLPSGADVTLVDVRRRMSHHEFQSLLRSLDDSEGHLYVTADDYYKENNGSVETLT